MQAKDALAEIWVDNVSLQPFTEEQWRSHQEQRISKVNKALYIKETCLFSDFCIIHQNDNFHTCGTGLYAGTQEDDSFECKRCKR